MSFTQDHMTKDFQLLAETLSPAEALELLTVDKYGVVLDEHSKPVALVIADDLKQAAEQGTSSLLDIKVGFPITIFIIGYQLDRQDLINLKSLNERYNQIRGVIVLLIDDNIVIGILPITTVCNYLRNDDYKLRGNPSHALGDSDLAGKFKSSIKYRYRCLECDFVNERDYTELDNPPNCLNPNNKTPHKLKLP